MRKIHLFSGIAVMIVFAITGQYMINSLNLPNLDFNAQRMMYRASHIYLLWSGAVNTLLGCYWMKVQGQIISKIQIFASSLIVLSQAFLLLAFYVEPPVIDPNRLLTFSGSLCLLIGVVLTVIITLVDKRRSSTIIKK